MSQSDKNDIIQMLRAGISMTMIAEHLGLYVWEVAEWVGNRLALR